MPLILKSEPNKVNVPEENVLWNSMLPPLNTVMLPPLKARMFGFEVADNNPVVRVTVPVADAELMPISGDVSVRELPILALPLSIAVRAPMDPLLA
jgi:hypothetical protein